MGVPMDNVFLLGFTLGILSGLSPTLMGIYTDIVSEIARTTRKEMDVVIRSLIFCAGVLTITCGVFVVLGSTLFLHFLGILLGFAVALNLFNTGLHTFNSYTRVDNYIKAKFIYLDSFSVL
jgi:cytochrome c biogenesis protein CcdA